MYKLVLFLQARGNNKYWQYVNLIEGIIKIKKTNMFKNKKR